MRLTSLIALFLFLFLASGKIHSQGKTENYFQLNKLNDQGVLLDRGWEFQPGDHPIRSTLSRDDKEWSVVNPLLPLYQLPQVTKAGMGCFRLKMIVDSSLHGKMISMVLTLGGAAEFYLGDRLVYQFGRVNANYSLEETRLFFGRPFSLKLSNQTVQTLLVRYSFTPRNIYINYSDHPTLKIVLKDVNTAFVDYNKVEGGYRIRNAIQLSIYLPLGLLLIFLFGSFRLRREYFYFSLFCLGMFIGMLIYLTALTPSVTATASNVRVLTAFVFYIAAALCFLNGTYILHKQRKSWIFYSVLLFGALTIPALLFIPSWGFIINKIFFPLIVVDFLRLNIQGMRRGKAGVVILVITGILFFLVITSSIFIGLSGDRQLSDIITAIAFVIPALGLSVFIASDFARTGSSLQQRVKEVEDLSRKAIIQEQEKQQLLSTQNEMLEQQVEERTISLTRSLKDLKETQAQLIQSEKMASLGELTAGIAHEIQNPLNFVNNFSEVNKELLVEMREEIMKGNFGEVTSIANDLSENQDKINEHGKRAEAIVKGMLLHSRTSSGAKELTDINKQADEFLRLSYHGFRAKDKSFNAVIETDYDQSVGSVNVVPQDIGRVLLNLFNNAFYAVNEKKIKQHDGYEPMVSVSTQRANDKINISVKDNGDGIPQKVVDKIFQPFFTTKPTGQGTGLGLSLAYDIIKAHGGEIKVETKEGEGTVFILQLPI